MVSLWTLVLVTFIFQFLFELRQHVVRFPFLAVLKQQGRLLLRAAIASRAEAKPRAPTPVPEWFWYCGHPSQLGVKCICYRHLASDQFTRRFAALALPLLFDFEAGAVETGACT